MVGDGVWGRGSGGGLGRGGECRRSCACETAVGGGLFFISVSCLQARKGVANYVVGLKRLLRRDPGSAGNVGGDGWP